VNVHCMICVGDAVMLCSVMLDDMLVCYCMMICIYVSRAGLLCLIGRDGRLWPIGAGLRVVWLNMFNRGHRVVNEVRWFSVVNRVLAYQVT
jgi:hypothetical protein